MDTKCLRKRDTLARGTRTRGWGSPGGHFRVLQQPSGSTWAKLPHRRSLAA